MDLYPYVDLIHSRVVSPLGYSRGYTNLDVKEVGELLAALPGTHIDWRTDQPSKMERVTIVKKDIQRYQCRIDGDLRFYDYIIVDDGIPARQQNYLWGRVSVGGTFINIATGEVIKKDKWIVVMGCCRGATVYIWKVLKQVGIGLKHQGYGKNGTVDCGAPIMTCPPGSIVLHQLRHPLRTMEACAVRIGKLQGAAPLIGYRYEKGVDDPILWVMRYWYYWHRLSESKAILSYPVERLSDYWDRICSIVGIDKPLPVVSTLTNSDRHRGIYPDLTWKLLDSKDPELTRRIMLYASSYGYDTSYEEASYALYRS